MGQSCMCKNSLIQELTIPVSYPFPEIVMGKLFKVTMPKSSFLLQLRIEVVL